MAFDLKFTTTDYNQGKSILITDLSTDWANVPAVDSVTFTISSMYSSVVVGVSPTYSVTITVPIGTTPFAEDFQYEITGTQLFGTGYISTIPNSIYTITMDLYNGGIKVTGTDNTYTSNEVFYYDALYVRDKFISELASYDSNITNKQMEYANWLDFLILTIESNTTVGNSSAIYYVFDTFTNLSS